MHYQGVLFFLFFVTRVYIYCKMTTVKYCAKRHTRRLKLKSDDYFLRHEKQKIPIDTRIIRYKTMHRARETRVTDSVAVKQIQTSNSYRLQ